MENVNLIGTEEVRQAGYNIRAAAESMAQTVSFIAQTNERLLAGIQALTESVENLRADLETRGRSYRVESSAHATMEACVTCGYTYSAHIDGYCPDRFPTRSRYRSRAEPPQ